MKNTLTLLSLCLSLQFIQAQNWNQIIKAAAGDRLGAAVSDRLADDQFGWSVAISGDYAVVGAHQEDEDASGGASLAFAGSAYIFKQTGGVWVFQQKIVPNDRAAGDWFGFSVAISGNYIILGAFFEDEDASGGATLADAGSAYIFKQTGGVWVQQQKIVASDRSSGDRFGYRVAMSGDYAIVGATEEDEDASGSAFANSAGSAYIFKQTAGVWAQQQKIVADDRAADDLFGHTVAINGDYAIVGAPQEDEDASGSAFASSAGSAYIFKQTAGVWSQQQKIVAADRTSFDQFGISVSISGDYAIVGAQLEDEDVSGSAFASSAGSAYIYKQTAGVWAQQQKIVAADRLADDRFGFSVSISGDYAIVGAMQEDEDASGSATASNAGSAYIFKQTAGIWAQQQKIVAGDRATLDNFGFFVAINGDYALVGAFNEDQDASGAATLSAAGSGYMFKQTAGTWAQQQKIVATRWSAPAPNDFFGYSVAMDGDYAIVGAYTEDEDASGLNTLNNAGSAYIFKRNGGTWDLQQKIVASDRAATDNFGVSVSIHGDYAIVGANFEDENASGGATVTNSGSAYIFKQTAGVWAQQQKIVATDRGVLDNFGVSVSIHGDYAIVGASFEDQDVSGANTLGEAGSAYIFKQTAGVWAQQQKIVAADRGGNDLFGYKVAIEGDYAIVGAFQEDEDVSGLNTLSEAGSAYIFKQTAGVWAQQQKIVATDRSATDNFGISVAISGDYAIVGANLENEDASGLNSFADAGSAYIFKQTAGVWAQQQKIVASDRATTDQFGISVSISGDYAIVGAYQEDENASGGATASNAGSAYIFKQTAGVWAQQQKIVSADRAAADNFGYTVAISGDYAIVGAPYEDESVSGGSTISNSGSAYIYYNTTPSITSFTPTSGCAATATVTITGINLTGATAVNIGGTAVSSYTVNSATQITATVGSGTTGTISVTTPGGTATSSSTFTVNTASVPTITAIETSGIANDGTICNGTNLKLSSTAATGYSWSAGGTGQTTTILSPTTNTTYTVTITDINSCTASASSNVTVNNCVPAEALSFDGSSDFISAPLPMNAVDDFTIEAYINPSSFSGIQIPVSYGFDNGVFGDGASITLNGNNLQVLFSGIVFFNTGYSFPATNQWYHIALVRSAGTMRVYVNGVQTPNTSTTTPNVPTDFRLGSQNGLRFFNGKLDEVRMWSRALCQGEINHNMNCELNPVGQTGLKALYHFNQGIAGDNNPAVTTLTDATGNGFNGTLNSFALTGSTSNWIAPGAVTTGIGCTPAPLTVCANTWTGATSTAWAVPGNWSLNVVPTSINDANVPNVTNDPVISTNAAVKNIDLAAGATLTINGTLTTNGAFTNDGAVTVKNGGGYLQNSTYGGAGTFTVENVIANTADGYRDLSSPVATTVADLAADFSVFGQNGVDCWYSYSPYPNVQVYDEAANNNLSTPTGNYYTGWKSYTGIGNPLSPMKGIAARTYAGGPLTIDLTGTPYNSQQTVSITKTGSASPLQDGWNFVGNPYPSSINWQKVIGLNSSITGSYYVFNTTGEYTGNWGTCNSVGACSGLAGMTKMIAPMQGFFVQATSNGLFKMDNSVRETTTANFYKTDELSNELRLTLTDGINSDEILTYTDASATAGYDLGLDAQKIPAGSTVYLSYPIIGTEYVINAMDEITETTVLPIIIWAENSGNYTLSANAMNLTGLVAYLRDNSTGVEIDLSANSPSLALTAAQTYTNYSIVFKATETPSAIAAPKNTISIYASGNQIYVNRSTTNAANITVTNLLGQTISETTATGKSTVITTANATEAQYLIVKVKEGNQVSVKKVFVTNGF